MPRPARVRSESDNLIFQHAGKSGAHIFDQTKVESISFAPTDEAWADDLPNPRRPVSATWSRKDSSSGTIAFDDLIDASGRVGIVSTKHYKNCKYNQGLKNVATWGYFKSTGSYGVGTPGWVWTIHLHNGTTSVGVIRNQAVATERKLQMNSPSSKEYYLDCVQNARGILKVIGEGQ